MGDRSEPHLVGVEREDLALRIALLDVKRVVGLQELSLPRLLEPETLASQPDVPGELHRDRARAGIGQIPLEDVRHQGDDDPGDVDPDVGEELSVFGRDDGVPEHLRDLVVTEDQPALRGELADQLPTTRVQARDGARRVPVELRDFG